MKKLLTPRNIILSVVALLLVATLVVGVIFVNDYYPATEVAVQAMSTVRPAEGLDITVEVLADNATLFAPRDPTAALVFYPGGKVDHAAYAPLCQALARRGILCVLVEMPLRLAFTDMNAADGVIAKVKKTHADIGEWYIGGHSLGGSMAASYAGGHTEQIDGLILLAAYSADDLAASDLRVLSILGSEDGVLNQDAYEKNRSNLPDGFEETVIQGGNHAGFGDYGAQSGDGTSILSDGEQIELTADIISMFVNARQ